MTSSALPPEPVRLAPPAGAPPMTFRRGARPPYAIRWYGVTSLLGHLRHFIASAIASEQVDSRDWMRPDDPGTLLRRIVTRLGGDVRAPTLADALGRPVWIDYVADAGDDRDVSAAVAKMVFATYRAPAAHAQGDSLADGAPRAEEELPRGDILVFGGDTAYPVATAEEIERRLIDPWNEVLGKAIAAGVVPKERVLLGIPGNHDWYDGLDGFGRLFRRTRDPIPAADRRARHDLLSALPPAAERPVGLVARGLHLDEVGGLVRLFVGGAASVRAFFAGSKIRRRKRLLLGDYEPVQEATYWALPLAPGLTAWGADRQLGRLDFRQRMYFHRLRKKAPATPLLLFSPDPAIAFGEAHDLGQRVLTGCRLSLEHDPLFFLTGDLHHYERRAIGRSVHVIAGGGGAFLHGTRIREDLSKHEVRAYPTAATSRSLLAQVPLRLALGSAGYLVHLAFAAAASIELTAIARGGAPPGVATAMLMMAICVVLYLIAGHRRHHPLRVALYTVPFGVVLGAAPVFLKEAVPRFVPSGGAGPAVVLTYAFASALAFGLFLSILVIAGLEHTQAFAVLGHPGFKHFVRLRVSPGGRIEAWVIGKDDPLCDDPPHLVDAFAWTGREDALPRLNETR